MRVFPGTRDQLVAILRDYEGIGPAEFTTVHGRFDVIDVLCKPGVKLTAESIFTLHELHRIPGNVIERNIKRAMYGDAMNRSGLLSHPEETILRVTQRLADIGMVDTLLFEFRPPTLNVDLTRLSDSDASLYVFIDAEVGHAIGHIRSDMPGLRWQEPLLNNSAEFYDAAIDSYFLYNRSRWPWTRLI